MTRLMLASLFLIAVGCGASQADGEGGCNDDGDCYTQLGDPPADASWRCVEHQCSAQGAGPFESEIEPEEPAEPEPTEAEPEGDTPPPPTGMPQDRSCNTDADCMLMGEPPADASWRCTDGQCGLRGAGPVEHIAPMGAGS